MWEIESIPDQDSLFYRIHHSLIKPKTKIPGPSAFQERGDGEEKGMSTDWEHYSTSEQCQQSVQNFNPPKRPEDYGVVSLIAGFLRNDLDLSVEHAPIENHEILPNNRAHTNVKGLGSAVRQRLVFLEALQKHIKWEILPPCEVDTSETRH